MYFYSWAFFYFFPLYSKGKHDECYINKEKNDLPSYYPVAVIAVLALCLERISDVQKSEYILSWFHLHTPKHSKELEDARGHSIHPSFHPSRTIELRDVNNQTLDVQPGINVSVLPGNS